ncbi:MAG: ActS/PrrB/RegB family redox-sensitive histidine kinase [Pseudotabrizicola sp.]|uniref:sensor histidine kinase RegB n=1 Tax=Pseudotabrizicola sp. TaxID=2939647 RepID=UPI002717DB16|nr:ActS/PrrB/RegB family redox-sensitive histidine kinase [Pseudotabrizicola sp.]MDO8882768.1 ActS/PrrB/RegB family redox-sensitive histidine kinase [Pseudotabrizicola sp.]MDP2083426.1 ActS/PrrB/RegB family redox-sensitive histidine kinase [Pseudotabrizicola sp.]MDZ7574964.1 ActS/PrrB/RegB family redox-sensitive histidine kinase [Pseudotabrizicola sp.]
MLSPGINLLSRDTRSDWVRLRTLILLRWMAIAGQLAAITVADRYYEMQLPLGLCYLAVGASIIANLVSVFVFPENKRLSEAEAMLTLLFDLSQLSFLLYLTGGLANPFALLILAPVTISASALELRTTLFLGSLSIVFITLIAFVHVPLRYADGSVLSVPVLFEFGFWLSIVIGILFLGLYSRRVATEIRSMSDALLATQMALAREQKLTDLGGVVAAAAHELGTPLATIKLVSAEMMDELKDQPALLEDARLIREQADRCRDILHSMGRMGKDDLHMRIVPLALLVQEAAEPHQGRGKRLELTFQAGPGGGERQPTVNRRPEVVHGLRNLIQNAVDFARSTVWIHGEWSADAITIRIADDGEGFPSHVIGRIGDPFVRSRRSSQDLAMRPEYEGMGLGLFIAKTLLERTGAELTFANASDPFLTPSERPERSGAVVEVVWPMARIAQSNEHGLGQNKQIKV